MRYLVYILILFVGGVYVNHSLQKTKELEQQSLLKISQIPPLLQGSVDDYFSENANLAFVVEKKLAKMSDKELAGIVLMPAYEKHHNQNDLKKWIQDYHVGGFMILRPDYSTIDRTFVNNLQRDDELPLLVSIDAEPSLLPYRLPSLKNIPPTESLQNIAQSKDAAKKISKYIKELGVNINFAPVYDANYNTSIIGNRSYGKNAKDIHALASAFSKTTKENNIVPTAKHFPGHGNVSGDTHKNLQTINGKLIELDQFKLAINDNIPIVMVGHLAIDKNSQWQTNGVPATLSRKITTDFLKSELGFNGLVITDALNMGALQQFDNIPIMALDAGADILLLPNNIDQAYRDIYQRIQTDVNFKKYIQDKARKIIRMKLVLRNIH